MANNAAFAITADFAELDDLQQLLAAARQRPASEREGALDRATDRAATEMRDITRAYPSPLDELSQHIETAGTPLYRRIFTTKRQGHFLHFGSPTTGAPRDWAHGPTQRAVDDMFRELSKAAEPW
ncbi:MAG TPA: hypothetical protein PLV68_17435 [Ilumatobacteraceae bacterium]|nr:hypothetical protein [Ilumatobacteraceae bacterium]